MPRSTRLSSIRKDLVKLEICLMFSVMQGIKA
jgi:hypothetical protein